MRAGTQAGKEVAHHLRVGRVGARSAGRFSRIGPSRQVILGARRGQGSAGNRFVEFREDTPRLRFAEALGRSHAGGFGESVGYFLCFSLFGLLGGPLHAAAILVGITGEPEPCLSAFT